MSRCEVAQPGWHTWAAVTPGKVSPGVRTGFGKAPGGAAGGGGRGHRRRRRRRGARRRDGTACTEGRGGENHAGGPECASTTEQVQEHAASTSVRVCREPVTLELRSPGAVVRGRGAVRFGVLPARRERGARPMTAVDLEPATRRMAALVGAVLDSVLDRPTPCPAYAVGDLLDHIGGLTFAFTAAARKDF